MLGKNNIKEWLRKDQDNQQRFSIRKFTVGVTSVLLACAFLGVNPHIVKVDAAENVANAEVASSEKEAEDTQFQKGTDKSEEVTTREKGNLQKYQEQNDTDSEKSTPRGPALVEGNKDKAQEQEQINVNTVPEKDASKESIPKDKDIQDRQVKDNINSKQKSNVKNIDSQVIDKDIKPENLTDNKTENTKNTDLSKDATTTSKDKTDKLVEDTNDRNLKDWYKDRQNNKDYKLIAKDYWQLTNRNGYTEIQWYEDKSKSGDDRYKVKGLDLYIPNTDDFIAAQRINPGESIYIDRNTIKQLVIQGAKSITFHKAKDEKGEVQGYSNYDNQVTQDDNSIKHHPHSWANTFSDYDKKNLNSSDEKKNKNNSLKYVDVSGLHINVDGHEDVDLPEMFYHDQSLQAVVGLENWDYVNPQNLGHFFSDCPELTVVSDISGWNQKGKVKYIDNMFNGDKKLASDLDLSKWDVKNTVAMTNMFDGVAENSEPIKVNISGWHFSNVNESGTGQNVFAGIDNFATSKKLVIIAQGIQTPNTSNWSNKQHNLFADGQVVITDKDSIKWLKDTNHFYQHQDTYSFHGALDDNSDFTKAFNEAGKNQSHPIFYDVDEIGGQEVLDKTPVKIVESAIKAAIAENIKNKSDHYEISNDIVNDISVNRENPDGNAVTAANGTYQVYAPIVVKYVDKDGTQIGKVYETKDKDLIGKETTLNSETIKPGIPAGWVPDIDAIKTQYGDEIKPQYGDGYVEIKIKHGTKEIKPGQHIDKGSDPTKGQPNVEVNPTDSEHTLNRVITVTAPDGTKTPVTQSIDFNRTGHIDTVTGKVTWDDWKPADSKKDSFASYTPDAIDGYTAGNVAGKTSVTYKTGDPDLKVSVGYTANSSSFKVQYVDSDKNPVNGGKDDQTFSGKTDGNVTGSIKLPAGWVVDGTAPVLPTKFVPSDKNKLLLLLLSMALRR